MRNRWWAAPVLAAAVVGLAACGSTASGGIIDNAAMNGESVARTRGTTPVAMPKTNPIAALSVKQ